MNSPSGLLGEETEDGQGAYLPVNHDDDNWDGEEDNATNTIEAGENDLLPLVIRLPENNPPAKVKISVTGGSSEVRLFKTDNVGETAQQSIEFNPDDLGLERVNDDPELGTGILIYAWGRETGLTSVKLEYDMNDDGTWVEADTVKLNVFDWSGPIAVPNYTKYTYTATGGLAGATSQWIGAKHGQVAGTRQENDGDLGTIFWNPVEPRVGGAIYRAATGFDWLLDVNIVQVKIENLSFVVNVNNGVYEGTSCGVPNFVMSNGNQQPAMEAKAKITVTGLVVGGDGVQRGVEYIDVGFIQLSTSRVLNVEVDANNPKQVPELDWSGTLRHYVQREGTWLDSITRLCQGPIDDKYIIPPWYDAYNRNDDEQPKPTGYFSGDTDMQYNQSAVRDLRIEDVPRMPLPLVFYGVVPGRNAYWVPRKLNLDWTFSTFIGIGTHAPGVYESDDVDLSETDKYTQRAMGKWSFNGTGTIQYANFDTPTWTAAGAGVTIDKQMTVIPEPDGSSVPTWTAPPAPPNGEVFEVLNDALKGWTIDPGLPGLPGGYRTYDSRYHELTAAQN